jgi:hypothetical protein
MRKESPEPVEVQSRARSVAVTGLYPLKREWIPERGARPARRDDRGISGKLVIHCRVGEDESQP